METALLVLLESAIDPVRVAVAPVRDRDRERAKTLGARIARMLLENTRYDVITAGRLEGTLDAASVQAVQTGETGPIASLAADHVVLAEVVSAGGEAELALRLLHTESGSVVAAQRLVGLGEGQQSTLVAKTVRGALSRLTSELDLAVRDLGGEHRYLRVAVAKFEARGEAATEGQVDRYVQAELIRSMKKRGFLVVERERFDQALQQLQTGALLDEEDAPTLGAALDAQALVVGSVADSGDKFLVEARVVSSRDGTVLGGSTAELPRANTVSLANRAIEVRTPIDAMFRSAVAPGWGQIYNRQPTKGALFATLVYGGAAATVAVSGAAAASWFLYQAAVPDEAAVGAARSAPIEGARLVRDILTFSAGGMALIVIGIWGAGAADALVTALYPE